jgi:hypothetical protein
MTHTKPSNGWAKLILIGLLSGSAVAGSNAVARNGTAGDILKLQLQVEAVQATIVALRADVRLLSDKIDRLP